MKDCPDTQGECQSGRNTFPDNKAALTWRQKKRKNRLLIFRRSTHIKDVESAMFFQSYFNEIIIKFS